MAEREAGRLGITPTAAAREKFRATFGTYFATGVYNDFMALASFEEEAGQILEAFKARDRGQGIRRRAGE